MSEILERSVTENREFAGEIIADDNGYRYTPARRGSVAGATINIGISAYEGAYHSHGATDRRYLSEVFSDADRAIADRTRKPSFVVTPTGRMLRYDAHRDPRLRLQGTERSIGRIQP